jgi:hypothetical protein
MGAPPLALVRRILLIPLLLSGCKDFQLPGRAGNDANALPPPPESPARPRARRDPAREVASAEQERLFFDQIRRGLRRLVVAEEGFFAENGVYTGDLERLGYTTEGETGIRFLWVSRDGWAASGTHPSVPGKDCVTFVGRAHGAPTTLKYVRRGREGAPVCDVAATGAAPHASTTTASPGPNPAPASPPADTGSALDLVNPFVQMKVDLRNLVRSQDAYLATQGIYSRRTEPFSLQYLWHRGVTIRVLSADPDSWSARAVHQKQAGKSCVIWFGPVSSRPATEAQKRVPERSGVPVCDD